VTHPDWPFVAAEDETFQEEQRRLVALAKAIEAAEIDIAEYVFLKKKHRRVSQSVRERHVEAQAVLRKAREMVQ
jgi:hypothetical protein